jgi:hypothetical protein
MKTYSYLTCNIIAAGVLLAGCATGQSGITLDPVGPAPVASAKASPSAGILVVYSAYEVNADFNSRDRYRPEYSDYKIFAADGKLLRRVHNDSGTASQDPAEVGLPAGEYRVAASSNGFGRVTIPVVIQTGQKTVLHLEGGVGWRNKSGFNQANAVRLPDGQIVGWRADSGSASEN